ncbi:Uncharacterized protein TCM_024542 [Theobroma cacao]|uniref:Uncharacterized protein n=1 Tax=Theobroma cacao TaxID=3641 RepID=A0A061EWG8_THECC|nr:Uncharacterized protein TCM_024542 [Theobroma cacao]
MTNLCLPFVALTCVTYTIEFQKRELPYVHILLWLHHDHKFLLPKDIDRIISAKLLCKHVDPIPYQAMTEFSIHGPCGVSHPNSPNLTKGEVINPIVIFANTTEPSMSPWTLNVRGRTCNHKQHILLDRGVQCSEGYMLRDVVECKTKACFSKREFWLATRLKFNLMMDVSIGQRSCVCDRVVYKLNMLSVVIVIQVPTELKLVANLWMELQTALGNFAYDDYTFYIVNIFVVDCLPGRWIFFLQSLPPDLTKVVAK